MIHTSRQLKALVRNLTKGDSVKAQIILRNYVMERFLERVSLSRYRNNLILKGGTLVTAMVGLDNRSTLDIDVTLKDLPLAMDNARKIVDEIISIQIADGMVFNIDNVITIMDEADYPGVRVVLSGMLEMMRIPLRIDFSTGDVITPKEITYSFNLMFEDRSISVVAYNLETVFAEKLETILSRGTANTRMRDFYDVYALALAQPHNIEPRILREAFFNTSNQRGSSLVAKDAYLVLDEIQSNQKMQTLWKNYQRRFEYAAHISWDDIMASIKELFHDIIPI